MALQSTLCLLVVLLACLTTVLNCLAYLALPENSIGSLNYCATIAMMGWLNGKSGAGVSGCGKHGDWWKTRDLVKNTGYGGKHGVWWKTRGVVENTGSGGKHGVWWKTRGLVENTRSKCKTGGLSKTQGNHFVFAKMCIFLT